MAKTVVGLEVTEECVRAAEVTVSRAPQLVSYGEVPLPPDAARDSEVLDQGTVAVALRQLWTGARLRAREVNLGVASRRILVREYTTEAIRPDLLRAALPFQVQDLLPVPASQAVLDFFPLSEADGQVSGLLVAAVSETIEQIIGALDKVKVRARNVDLTTFGLARASAAIASHEQTVAVVFIGDHTTQIAVARGGVPQFVRLLPVDMPTNAVQRRLVESGVDVDLPEAVPEPVVAGSILPANAPRMRGAMRGSGTASVAVELAARIRSTLGFFATRPNATPVESVLITGAGAAAAGVHAAISTAVDVPVQILGVEDIVGVKGTRPAGDLALNLVSTVGLALGEAR